MRFPRLLRRVLAWFLGATVLILVAVHCVLLWGLDRPWIKQRILHVARGAAGLDVDYHSVHINLFRGATIEGLVVRSPEEVGAVAPELARVGHIEAQFSLLSILRGKVPLVERIAIRDVGLTVALDENLRTSFDAIPTSSPPSPPSPPVPLSRQAAKILGGPLPFGHLALDGLTLTLVQSDHGVEAVRTTLKGVGLSLSAGPAQPSTAGWRLDAHMGLPAAPLALDLTRGTGEAKARLWVTLGVDSKALSLALDLRMVDQTFAQSVSADHWLHAEAAAQFDPEAGRTKVTVDRFDAGDGAASAGASVELPDTGDPVVLHASVDVDIARLLRWVPEGLLPLTAEKARAHCDVDGLVAGATVKLVDGGVAKANVELAGVSLKAPSGQIDVPGATLTAHAAPGAGGMSAKGSLELEGVNVGQTKGNIGAHDVSMEFDGQRSNEGAIAGKVGLRVQSVDVEGPTPVAVREASVEVGVAGLRPGGDPMATRGDVTLDAKVASLDARTSGTHAAISSLDLHAHTLLKGGAPFGGEVEASVSRLRAVAAGKTLADAPARVEIKARDVHPDANNQEASTGAIDAKVSLADVEVSLQAKKEVDAIDYDAHVATQTLLIARPFLTPDLLAVAPWDRMSLGFHSAGRLEHLHAPSIRHATEIDLHPFAFRTAAAQSLAVSLTSQGTALQHKADLEVKAPGLTLGGSTPSDDHLTISATVDRAHPAAKVKVTARGRAAADVDASVSFDLARRAVVYDAEVHVAGLAPLVPLASKVRGLEGFDLSQLELGLSTHGDVIGAVESVTGDGALRLAPDPAKTAAVEGTTDLKVAHFKWEKGDTAVITPSVAWHAVMRVAGEKRTMESHFESGPLHLDLGIHDVDLNGIQDSATATVVGDLTNPDVQLDQRFAVSSVTQDFVPQYPLGDVSFGLKAERGREGAIHISEMQLTNGTAGTALNLSGNVDLGEGRRTLSLNTSLTQDLAHISTIPERFTGTGKVAVEASVTSPDFLFYKVRAAVKGDEVTVRLPHEKIEVDGANGEVPITLDVLAGPHGVTLERTEKNSHYSMLRFADQHPLLARNAFLSIPRLQTPFLTIAPLVGNLAIEQNVISLRQFEMGVRGGTITGQLGLDYDGPRSTVEVHVRASGVQSSHGEPFDGNIAVNFSLADRSIEGRAEILRIGERHLLDLLDLQDPLHVDPAYNRVRMGLDLGYPEGLHLEFAHGFASAHIELGGLGKLIKIQDLRGIPVGKILDQRIGPMLEASETKEAP
jgi:hypothetical protein